MKITYLLMITALFLGGCGDVSVSTTSDGGSANAPDPVVVTTEVVE